MSGHDFPSVLSRALIQEILSSCPHQALISPQKSEDSVYLYATMDRGEVTREKLGPGTIRSDWVKLLPFCRIMRRAWRSCCRDGIDSTTGIIGLEGSIINALRLIHLIHQRDAEERLAYCCAQRIARRLSAREQIDEARSTDFFRLANEALLPDEARGELTILLRSNRNNGENLGMNTDERQWLFEILHQDGSLHRLSPSEMALRIRSRLQGVRQAVVESSEVVQEAATNRIVTFAPLGYARRLREFFSMSSSADATPVCCCVGSYTGLRRCRTQIWLRTDTDSLGFDSSPSPTSPRLALWMQRPMDEYVIQYDESYVYNPPAFVCVPVLVSADGYNLQRPRLRRAIVGYDMIHPYSGELTEIRARMLDEDCAPDADPAALMRFSRLKKTRMRYALDQDLCLDQDGRVALAGKTFDAATRDTPSRDATLAVIEDMFSLAMNGLLRGHQNNRDQPRANFSELPYRFRGLPPPSLHPSSSAVLASPRRPLPGP